MSLACCSNFDPDTAVLKPKEPQLGAAPVLAAAPPPAMSIRRPSQEPLGASKVASCSCQEQLSCMPAEPKGCGGMAKRCHLEPSALRFHPAQAHVLETGPRSSLNSSVTEVGWMDVSATRPTA